MALPKFHVANWKAIDTEANDASQAAEIGRVLLRRSSSFLLLELLLNVAGLPRHTMLPETGFSGIPLTTDEMAR